MHVGYCVVSKAHMVLHSCACTGAGTVGCEGKEGGAIDARRVAVHGGKYGFNSPRGESAVLRDCSITGQKKTWFS